MIVCGKRNVYSSIFSSVESQVLYLTILKRKKFKLTFKGCNRPVCHHLFGFTSVFLSKFVAFHPRTVKRIVMALMPSLSEFSLFLPHLRTLAKEEISENCLRFGTSGPSLCLYPFFPALTRAARAKKKNKSFLAK